MLHRLMAAVLGERYLVYKFVNKHRTMAGKGEPRLKWREIDGYMAMLGDLTESKIKIRIKDGALDAVSVSSEDSAAPYVLKGFTVNYDNVLQWTIKKLMAEHVMEEELRLRIVKRAENVFGITSALLPPRIVNEELGDALEDVQSRLARGRPHYEIRLKIWAAVVWAVFHSGTYLLKRLGKAVSSFRRTSK